MLCYTDKYTQPLQVISCTLTAFAGDFTHINTIAWQIAIHEIINSNYKALCLIQINSFISDYTSIYN